MPTWNDAIEAEVHQRIAANEAEIARACANCEDPTALWMPPLTPQDVARTLRQAVVNQERAALLYYSARGFAERALRV